MLYTLAVILLIAWLLGVVGTYTIGAFVHVLLVIAVVLFLVGIISGTYSTVFIAAAIAIILSGKQAKARAAASTRPAGGRKAS